MLWLIAAVAGLFGAAALGNPVEPIKDPLLTAKKGQYWRLYFSLSRAMTEAEKAEFEKGYVASMAPYAEVLDGAFKSQSFPGAPSVNYLVLFLHYIKDPPGAFKMGRDNAVKAGDLTVILETVTPVTADYKEPA